MDMGSVRGCSCGCADGHRLLPSHMSAPVCMRVHVCVLAVLAPDVYCSVLAAALHHLHLLSNPRTCCEARRTPLRPQIVVVDAGQAACAVSMLLAHARPALLGFAGEVHAQPVCAAASKRAASSRA